MEKNFKKFTSFPVALHSLNLNDGHFYPDLQNSANELYTISNDDISLSVFRVYFF